MGWGKGGNVTSAGWQVTLCDPMWHVSSCSGVATLRLVTVLNLKALYKQVYLSIYLSCKLLYTCYLLTLLTHSCCNSQHNCYRGMHCSHSTLSNSHHHKGAKSFHVMYLNFAENSLTTRTRNLTGKPPSVLPSNSKLPLLGKQLSSGSLACSNTMNRHSVAYSNDPEYTAQYYWSKSDL